MTFTDYINDEKITFHLMAQNKDNAVQYFEFESYQNRPTLNEYIQEQFNRQCSCAHDCCGHWFTSSIDLLSVYKDQWLVVVKSAQNY